MTDVESIHEIRRRAPLHYWAKAVNAHYTSYVLSHSISNDALEKAAEAMHYGGTPWVAVDESSRREAAIAIELIIKAVIARKVASGVAPKNVTHVRPSHDVVALWGEAGLPKLPVDDRRRLLRIKSLLYWSSRYAAPKSDKDADKEIDADETLKGSKENSGVLIEPMLSLGWDDFDRIYQVALSEWNKHWE